MSKSIFEYNGPFAFTGFETKAFHESWKLSHDPNDKKKGQICNYRLVYVFIFCAKKQNTHFS